jgi:hypothetical protein
MRAMKSTCSPKPTRRLSKRAIALWLAAVALPLLGTGCTTAAPAGETRFGCYDGRAQLQPAVDSKTECESRGWRWRELV